MVTDLTVARDHQTKFEEFVAGHPELNPGIDLAVTVLTTGFWPSYKSFDINLPSEMASFFSLFMFKLHMACLTFWTIYIRYLALLRIIVWILNFSGEMRRGFQRVLPNKNKAQEAYLDIFPGNL